MLRADERNVTALLMLMLTHFSRTDLFSINKKTAQTAQHHPEIHLARSKEDFKALEFVHVQNVQYFSTRQRVISPQESFWPVSTRQSKSKTTTILKSSSRILRHGELATSGLNKQ
jgi:hypothetical protein